jgi:hypothetical protein
MNQVSVALQEAVNTGTLTSSVNDTEWKWDAPIIMGFAGHPNHDATPQVLWNIEADVTQDFGIGGNPPLDLSDRVAQGGWFRKLREAVIQETNGQYRETATATITFKGKKITGTLNRPDWFRIQWTPSEPSFVDWAAAHGLTISSGFCNK